MIFTFTSLLDNISVTFGPIFNINFRFVRDLTASRHRVPRDRYGGPFFSIRFAFSELWFAEISLHF